MSRHKNKFIKSAKTPQRRRPPVIDFQNEIVEMYVRREAEEEGRENGRGRRFIKRAFTKRLRTNQTFLSTSGITTHMFLLTMKRGLEWCFINSKKVRLG